MPSLLPPFPSSTSPPRRVRKTPPLADERPPRGEPAQELAPDSLGRSLQAAARVLVRVQGGASLNEARRLLADEPSAARAAAQDVIYGVLRRYGWGEFILGRLLIKLPTQAEIHALLLAALYRLDTRPESAPMVVDQAVAAAGGWATGAFKGLVNGVLRNFLRQRPALLAALAADEEARYQHPRWWLARLRADYRSGWTAIVEAGNSPPPLGLRVNRCRIEPAAYLAELAAAGLAARLVGRDGLILEKAVPVEALPGFPDGRVSVQDLGAQLAAQWLAPAPGSRVLDACAAPGGKTAHLLETAMLDLLALDIDAGRVRRIEENLDRLGLSAEIKVADCTAVASWWDGRLFDAILADVPCSASGVVRRHPDVKRLRRASDIRRFVLLQRRMLDALWPLLKPGGQFLYATCSVFAEENVGQIDAFLVRQTDARRLRMEQLVPDREHDGFFYTLLQKNAAAKGA